MVDKRYLDAQSLLEDSWHLGAMIQASGFKPDFICAIWRGGVPIGIALQSFLARFGTQSDHIAIRTAKIRLKPRRLNHCPQTPAVFE